MSGKAMARRESFSMSKMAISHSVNGRAKEKTVLKPTVKPPRGKLPMTGLDVRYPQREVLQLDGQLLLIKSVLLILFLLD